MYVEAKCSSCAHACFIRLERLVDDGDGVGATMSNTLFPADKNAGPAPGCDYQEMYARVLSDILSHTGGCDECGAEVTVNVRGDN